MPKIKLKEKSPEFIEETLRLSNTEPRECDIPGCLCQGDHRAPKDRALSDYYYFCQIHAREYNANWNFFEGMSQDEIESYLYKATLWDRPTWRFSDQAEMEHYLRKKVRDNFFDEDNDGAQEQARQENRNRFFEQSGTPEGEALAIMGLEPPVTLPTLKKKYKALVKKHHPDANGGSKDSEEILKKINMAYTVLKVAYESFEKLDS